MTPYDQYVQYVSSVEELAEAAFSSSVDWKSSLAPSGLLDGQAAAALSPNPPKDDFGDSP